MQVGVNLINFGPGATPTSLSRWAQLAEALGYHLLMTSDHIAVTPDVQARYPAPFFEPLSTLGWLAGITRTIAIGTTVIIVPYRHPLEMAKVGANVDQLSGGRFIFGVGVGWAQQEFAVLGAPFHRRGAMTDEYLEAIKCLWTQDIASYEGRFVTFKDVHTGPRPVQSPHPPIWIGGSSEAAMCRAVRYGDAWHPNRLRLAWLRDTGIPRLQAIAEREGRPAPALCPRLRLRLTEAPLDDAQRLIGEGTLTQVRHDLAALQALGCKAILLDTYYDDVEATRQNETAWRMLTVMAEQALDLPHQTLK